MATYSEAIMRCNEYASRNPDTQWRDYARWVYTSVASYSLYHGPPVPVVGDSITQILNHPG